ncbi:MAG: (deoxy)nucleoside triphosphate pyrophosphohydrolase [Actinobacteria bacterium]|nr:(deoxy)nucleoside triphosphate pyrophosphohydrolase [Actinomycetota bacterium]
MTSDKRHVVAAAIVDDLNNPTRVLAARRTSPFALAGLWEFPGGKIESGESVLGALDRELREELGIRSQFGGEIVNPAPQEWNEDIQGFRPPPWPISAQLDLVLFTAEIVDGEPNPREAHDEIRWVSPANWHELPWLEPDRPMLVALEKWMLGEPSGWKQPR